jgi:hypothetical protein
MKYLRPDISVIVARGNRVRQMEQMLLRIENQAFEGLSCELIVIDIGRFYR